MRVRILLFGKCRDAAGTGEMPFVARGSTMGALWEELAALHPGLAELGPTLLMSRNLKLVKEDSVIAEDDEVAFFPMVSGG